MKRALILLFGFLLALGSPGAVPKVAILSTEQDLATAVDVLTAALSKNNKLALLERSEMQRIVREQGLSAEQQKDYLKLGRLLGADGLLVFSLSRPTYTATQTLAFVRWIAVRPGVMLDSELYPLPLQDSLDWAARVASRTAALTSKMSVLRQDAVGISILNLRAALRGSATRDRYLTTMLLNRLSRETNLFVMERRSLDRLESEKLLSSDESAFWNGCYTLEGTINSEGVSTNSISVDMRLVSRDGKDKRFKSTQPLNQEAELIEDLTKKILESIGGQAAGTFDPVAEAKAYLEEAQWALKWQIYGEAQSAANASWAMGNQSAELAALRVRSYCRAVLPCVVWGGATGETRFVEGKLKEVETGRIRSLCPIDRSDLTFTETAIQLAHDGFAKYARTNGIPNPDWTLAVNEALRTATTILHLAFLNDENRKEFSDELAALRRQCRDLAEELLPMVDQMPKPKSLLEDPRPTSLAGSDFWYERPEDAIPFWRNLVRRRDFPEFRRVVIRQSYSSQMQNISLSFADWTDPEHFHGHEVWLRFLEELKSSPEPQLRLEGVLLTLAHELPEGKLAGAVREAVSLVREQAPSLVEKDTLKDTWYFLREAVSARCSGFPDTAKEQVRQEFPISMEDYDRWFHDLEAKKDQTIRTGAREKELQDLQKYLRDLTESPTFKPFELLVYWKLGGNKPAKREEAALLIPLLNKYRERIPEWQRGLAAQPRFGPMFSSSNTVAMEMNKLEFVTGARTNTFRGASSPNPSVLPNLPPGSRSGSISPPSATPPAGSAPARTEKVQARFVPLKTPPPTNSFWRGPVVHTHPFRSLDDSVWVSVARDFSLDVAAIEAAEAKGDQFARRMDEKFILRPDRQPSTNWVFIGEYPKHLGLVRIDPSSGQQQFFPVSDAIVASPMNTAMFSPSRTVGPPDFAVTKQYAVVLSVDRIHVLQRNSGKWKLSAQTVVAPTTVTSIGQRFFINNAESILEYLPESDEIRILASTRRRPPVTILDSLDLKNVSICDIPGDGPHVILGAAIYQWTGENWQKRLTLPRTGAAFTFGSSLLVRSLHPYQGNVLFKVTLGKEAVLQTLIHEHSAMPGTPQLPPPRPGQIIPAENQPIFTASPGGKLLGDASNPNIPPASVCLGQNDLWVLSGRLMVDAVNPARADPELILHRYRFGQKQSQPFKLELEIPHPVADNETVRQIVSSGNELLTLLPLERHLVIVPKWIAGVWIIPWQALSKNP